MIPPMPPNTDRIFLEISQQQPHYYYFNIFVAGGTGNNDSKFVCWVYRSPHTDYLDIEKLRREVREFEEAWKPVKFDTSSDDINDWSDVFYFNYKSHKKK